MKRLIIDMDDVLADTSEHLLTYYKQERDVQGKPLTGKELETIWTSVDFQKSLRPFLFQDGFFRTLPVKSDSPDVMRRLYSRYEVFIVSAATEFPLSLFEKIEWLKEHFSFIEWQRIVFCGDKRIVTGDVLIDDSPHNLGNFQNDTYIFSAPHNIGEKRFNRVNSWKDIEKLFL